MPESRDEVRIFAGLPVPVLTWPAALPVLRACEVWLLEAGTGPAAHIPVGWRRALWGCAGAVFGVPREHPARAHPPLAARPEGEQPGSVACIWRARGRRCRYSSLVSACSVRGEEATLSLPPVLGVGGGGLPPGRYGCAFTDTGARPFGTCALLGVVRPGGRCVVALGLL